MPDRALVYNDDGWSSLMRYPAPLTPADLVRVTVEPVAGTGVSIYQLGALGGHAVHYRSDFLPVVGALLERCDTMHVWRLQETVRHLRELGTDPVAVICEACHQRGLAFQFSLRMNDRHHTYKRANGEWYFPELLSPWLLDHPELLLPDGGVDYAHPEVHAYRLRQAAEVLERYDVDGIDLDFTRFRPWFAAGQEDSGRPLMTDLIRRLRELTAAKKKTLSARFEYDPEVCERSGLAVGDWLAEGLLDQVTLGGVGDHTPDAPSKWWVERAHAIGARVFPGVEGQLHWIVSSGGGGQGMRAGKGVWDGFGPPSPEYLRAVAARHYADGADGLSLFNFSCADGPWDREVLSELTDAERVASGDKQYVWAMWPWDAQVHGNEGWESRFVLEPGQAEGAFPLLLAEDVMQPRFGDANVTLTLELKGLNRLDDVAVLLNLASLEWTGYHYNHYDHGCWNDIVQFTVPRTAVRCGENALTLRRIQESPGFEGKLEVRKCVLEIGYPHGFAPGRISNRR